MEWYWDSDKRPRLRDKVALIQIACERKIGLFHIARHDGNTTEELIAPALRRIIESANIIKTGVGILSADFSRLQNFFQLAPRGAVELSHLNNLVTFGSQNPDKVTTRLRALSKLVEDHLGLPLFKGSVRKSDWSLPLDDRQKTYAADDAYAGYMLFHRMNALRLKMTPIPPLPKLGESYLPFAFSKVIPVQLEPVPDRPEAAIFTARDFFQPESDEVTDRSVEKTETSKPLDIQPKGNTKDEKKTVVDASKDLEISREIYKKLVLHRRILAKAKGISAFIIATNKILDQLSKSRPTNKKELLKVHGVGENKASLYGDEWLQIISQYNEECPREIPEKAPIPLQSKSPNVIIPNKTADRQKPLDSAPSDSPDELYQRLYEHRKSLATIRGCLSYVIATNLVLEAIARERPTTYKELLAIDDITESQVATYGPAWLRIIAGFEADPKPRPLLPSISETPAESHPKDFFQKPHPQLDHRPPTHNRIKHVGRSIELLPAQPTGSTGLSFKLSETNLSVDKIPVERDDDVCYDGPEKSTLEPPIMPPISPQLKRKRIECSNSPSKKANTADLSLNPTSGLNPPEVPVPPPVNKAEHIESLGPQHRILRNKLDAYVKSVVWLMNPKPAQPIVSEHTLQCLVTTLPRTLDELHQVPGIESFFQACQGVKKDLWLTFSTWTRSSGLVPNS
ncbi:uncharacterized protein GGS22DRAFT_156218 [Annulohypoxylon maeteangense]|uniref:uncharacterized protein n=1 Tax=Annulohypoxylon maeteangense TaxID=1927788 RepID=UPI0020082228|nr:uncharacterized protein GGS22DRAFT_156218 [Annulohypoxylon maeteangense]KAI0887123.1 hypothetical protein GGS22DRAFT_156218 [Annulohypoxylon maeteangense]